MKGKEMNKYQEYQEYQDALEKMFYDKVIPTDLTEEELKKCDKTIQELVEKTRPLKPLHKSVLKQFGRCEKCNAPIDIRNHMRFCGTCGQAIDWTNETE